MKKNLHVYVVFILTLLCFILPLSVFADTPTPTPSDATPSPTVDSSNASDIQSKINDLEKKVSDTKQQENTLGSAITVMDNQIKLTQLRISSTQDQLAQLNVDIKTASTKINSLETSLNDIIKALLKRMVASYKAGDRQQVEVLFTSTNLGDYLANEGYLKVIQDHDRRLIYDTQQARNDYTNQKNIFETEKQKAEALQKQLQDYNTQLDQQKKDKQALLQKTQSDEAVYQQQLAAARAEQAAIQQISSGGGSAVLEGNISAGDVVGYMISGRSACSSGTHLHYEVHDSGGSTQNPAGYLSGHDVIWENSPDSSFGFTGSWQWPLSDPIRIEQGYGMTYWARTGWYGGGPHTGIDMFSDTSAAVRAVKAGKLYRGGIACGGGTLMFARVDQDDGTQSYYLHIYH